MTKCPMAMNAITSEYPECIEEKCEWWFVGGGCCIRAIADRLINEEQE